ncbi:hypothetical protein [Dokdonia sp. Asnod1-B02]|uniref:hypothetical protein n=1 Tax=Dokdonia sp. Asnod1-B02 TaxID=3160573 RepID=UPI00386AB594
MIESESVLAGMVAQTLLKSVVGDGYKYVKGLAINKAREGNLFQIFTKAREKIEDVDDGKSVPPKIIAKVINEGSWAADELNQDYYAGILASSRTDEGTDDSGIYYLNLLERLSVYQIKFHYLFYKSLKEKITIYNQINRDDYYESIHSVSERNLIKKDKVLPIQFDELYIQQKLGLTSMDRERFSINYEKIITTLINERLIANNSTRDGIPYNEDGLTPTAIGLDFFLWINGLPLIKRDSFLTDDVVIDDMESFKTGITFRQVLDELKEKTINEIEKLKLVLINSYKGNMPRLLPMTESENRTVANYDHKIKTISKLR